MFIEMIGCLLCMCAYCLCMCAYCVHKNVAFICGRSFSYVFCL